MLKTQGLLKNPRKKAKVFMKKPEPKVGSKNPRSLEKTQGVATLMTTARRDRPHPAQGFGALRTRLSRANELNLV